MLDKTRMVALVATLSAVLALYFPGEGFDPSESLRGPEAGSIDTVPARDPFQLSRGTNADVIPQAETRSGVRDESTGIEPAAPDSGADDPTPSSPSASVTTNTILESPGKSVSGSRDPRASRLRRRITEEPWDGEWAGRTESTLLDRFYAVSLPGNHIHGIDCRSTLCRIEIAHDDPVSEQSFLSHIASSGDFVADDRSGVYLRQVDARGSARTVFYLSREGYDLSRDSF